MINMSSTITTVDGLNYQTIINLCHRAYQEHNVRVGDIEAIVITNHDIKVHAVAIRGTELKIVTEGGILDMIRNISAWPKYDKRVGWSHWGFLSGAQGLVDKGLFGMLRRGYSIHVLGHSLGGAVALNVGAILKKEGFNVRSVYTVGAPRTFLRSTVTKYNKLNIVTIEFQNSEDPIINLPFKTFLRPWQFAHCYKICIKVNERKGLNAHSLSFYKTLFKELNEERIS